MGHSAIYILIHFYDSAMKCIWSIGNKINDGHKALAVLTLNNLLFDAKSFTFYMTQCLSSQPCALTVKLDGGGRVAAMASVWTSEDERFSRCTSLFFVFYMIVFCDGKKLDLWEEAWSWSLETVWSNAPAWHGQRKYPLSESDGGQRMELSNIRVM